MNSVNKNFPEVIEERKRYYSESNDYKMIAGDARDHKWLTNIKERKCAIVVMEGVSINIQFRFADIGSIITDTGSPSRRYNNEDHFPA